MIAILIVSHLLVAISLFVIGFSMGLNLGVRQKMTKHRWKTDSHNLYRECTICGEVQNNSHENSANNKEDWYTVISGDYTEHMQ